MTAFCGVLHYLFCSDSIDSADRRCSLGLSDDEASPPVARTRARVPRQIPVPPSHDTVSVPQDSNPDPAPLPKSGLVRAPVRVPISAYFAPVPDSATDPVPAAVPAPALPLRLQSLFLKNLTQTLIQAQT